MKLVYSYPLDILPDLKVELFENLRRAGNIPSFKQRIFFIDILSSNLINILN